MISKRCSCRIYQIRIPGGFQFFLNLKKDGKVIDKSTVTLRHNFADMVNLFVFWSTSARENVKNNMRIAI